MKKIRQNNYFVLTGAMGAGKSTLLNEIRKLGVICIDEPARQILAEQRAIQGNGVPDKDKKLFVELLLSRSLDQFNQMQDHKCPVIFDRGIPDNVCYAQLFNLNPQVFINFSHRYYYNHRVFFILGAKEIYINDEERKMSFHEANQFGQAVRKIYEDLNYEVIDVPISEPKTRAEFILKYMS